MHVIRFGELLWYDAVYAGLVLLTLWWTRGLYRRLRRLQAETAQLRMPDPPTPPSFEGLSDGTQHAENIERMQ